MVPGSVLCGLFGKNAILVLLKGIEGPADLLKSLLVETLFEWSHIWDFTLCLTMSDFLSFVRYSI